MRVTDPVDRTRDGPYVVALDRPRLAYCERFTARCVILHAASPTWEGGCRTWTRRA